MHGKFEKKHQELKGVSTWVLRKVLVNTYTDKGQGGGWKERRLGENFTSLQ
jgi:hypothetical protein